MRGSSPNLVISDHPLTEGVQQLYVFPKYSFDGTKNADPILEMTDARGAHGLVIATLRIGRGLMILDGTARHKDRFLVFFKGIPDFDEDHPNAVKQNETWNSYDWSRLFGNAKRIAAIAYQSFNR